jgi:hypothetical protein
MDNQSGKRPMHHNMLKSLVAACLAVGLFAGVAYAEPETAEEEEDPDVTFAESLLGKSYTGDLELDGWINFGGGLVSPPIYVNLYQREDETSLVVTSKLSAKKYEVIDTLLISKPWKGYAISVACTKGEDFTLRFIGDARGPESKEWWTEVRRAWEITVKTEPKPEDDAETETETGAEAAEAEPKPEIGTITKTNTQGVRCTNPNW